MCKYNVFVKHIRCFWRSSSIRIVKIHTDNSKMASEKKKKTQNEQIEQKHLGLFLII